jgi:hypothetical protein
MTEMPPPGEPQPDPTRQAPILPPPPPDQPPSYQQPAPHGAGPVEKTDAAGFLRALFDFSFSTFITPKVVRFVYVLATALIAIGWLFWLVLGFTRSAGLGLFILIVGPIIALVYLAIVRMTLEFYLAITRMSEDIHHRLSPRA